MNCTWSRTNSNVTETANEWCGTAVTNCNSATGNWVVFILADTIDTIQILAASSRAAKLIRQDFNDTKGIPLFITAVGVSSTNAVIQTGIVASWFFPFLVTIGGSYVIDTNSTTLLYENEVNESIVFLLLNLEQRSSRAVPTKRIHKRQASAFLLKVN